MTLSDADVVRAGNAALRLLDLPPTAQVSVDTEYALVTVRFETGELMTGCRGVGRDGDLHCAAVEVLDGITNDISESSTFWGIAFPRCPGHAHPADWQDGRDWIALSCPETGAEFRRVTV